MPILMLFLLSLIAYLPVAAQPLSLETALARPILAANQPLVEVQVYTASHVKSMPLVSTAQQWTQTKEQLRQQLLNEVVLRGEVKQAASAQRQPPDESHQHIISALPHLNSITRFAILPLRRRSFRLPVH